MIGQVITLCFISIFIGLSQTAGIGGGPIINVCLMLSNYFSESGTSGSFSSKESISITYLFIIGGSIASIWKNSQRSNGKTKKSYVNIDLIMLTMPLMSAGSMVGSALKNLLSELLIFLLFLTVFALLISQTYKKLQQITRKDQEGNKQNSPNIASSSENIIKQTEYNKIQVKHAQNCIKVFAKYKICWLILQFAGLYLLTFGMILFRGDTNYDSVIGINQCSLPALVIYIIYIGICFSVMWALATLIKKTKDTKAINILQISQISQTSTRTTIQTNNLSSSKSLSINESDKVHEISLEYSTIKNVVIGGFLAGTVGATLGIGGAPILIPIWLKSGIDHNVAASSTATLILSSSLIAFTISGLNKSYSQISYTEIAFYVVLAFISSALMKDLLTHVAEKYKLKYLVLVLLMAIFALSLLLLIPIQIATMMEDMQAYIRFGNVC